MLCEVLIIKVTKRQLCAGNAQPGAREFLRRPSVCLIAPDSRLGQCVSAVRTVNDVFIPPQNQYTISSQRMMISASVPYVNVRCAIVG